MSRSKKVDLPYVLFLIFFYFFLLKDYLERMFPILMYTDELLAVMAVPIFLVNLKKGNLMKKNLGYGLFIALFLIAGLFGTVIYRYQPFVTVALPDMFLCAKFWLTIYVGQYALKGMRFRHYATSIYKHIKFVSWTYFIMIILNYAGILEFPFATERYGLPSIKLFYFHPTVLVFNCVLLLAILISIKSYIHGMNKYFFLICFIACTSLRSKAFGAVALFVFVYYVVFIYRKKVNFKSLLILIPAILAIAWNQIQFYFFSDKQDESARFMLMRKAFDIIRDCFPIGTGYGTYACYMSGEHYSPVYYKYGLDNVWGILPGQADFVSDNFWPMVLGQTGILGTIFFVIAVIKLFQQIQTIEKRSLALYSSALIVLIYVLIDSTSSAAFVTPLSIPLAFWLGVVLNEAKERQRLHDERKAAKMAENMEYIQNESPQKLEESVDEEEEIFEPFDLNEKLPTPTEKTVEEKIDFKLKKPEKEN